MTPSLNFHFDTEAYVFILDFYDSFTFNIASFYEGEGLKVAVIPWIHYEELFSFLLHRLSPKRKVILVLGPGPGHPHEYQKILDPLIPFFEKKNIYLLGICLGHQLLGLLFGGKIIKKNPMHGQTIVFKIPPWDCFLREEWGQRLDVTRYNSLFVEFDGLSQMSFYGKNFISYQFHPESVGTSCPKVFFGGSLRFFYNNEYDYSTPKHSSKNRRPL